MPTAQHKQRTLLTISGSITSYLLDIQRTGVSTPGGLHVVLSETNGANVIRHVHSLRGIHAHKDASNNWEWPLQDGLGSVREVVDNTVAVLESRNYDPFGVGFGNTGTSQTNYGFTGELLDGGGLLDLRARRYAAGLGVFASLDPFEGMRDRAMSLNGYSWVEGNPINLTDPSGECPMCIVAAAYAVEAVFVLAAAVLALIWLNAAREIGKACNNNMCFGPQTQTKIKTKAQQVAEDMLNGKLPVSGSDPDPDPHPLEDPNRKPPPLEPPGLPPDRKDENCGSTVYRVQGGGGSKPTKISWEYIYIDQSGGIGIDWNVVKTSQEDRLYVTFDNVDRVLNYLQINRRGGYVISFNVKTSFVEKVRRFAYRQREAKDFIDLFGQQEWDRTPDIADTTKSYYIDADGRTTYTSFGLPFATWVPELQTAVCKGTGQKITFDESYFS